MFKGRHRYVALALITFVLALSSGDRATLSVAGPHMSKALGLDAIQMGWLFSAFAWAYVLGQIPAGWVVDRFGTDRVIYGSDWPVLTLTDSYCDWYGFTERWTAPWSVAERSGVYGDNAAGVYDL